MTRIEDLVISRLLEEKDEEYCKFSSSLLPGITNVLGVRLPILRRLAKWLLDKDYECFLSHAGIYFEEIMLQGMLIGLIKETPNAKLERIKKFLPKIDNWSVCDSFCSGLKFVKNNQELVWEFILPLTKSQKEYYVRFALVIMLDYFVNETYIDKILECAQSIRHEGYYAKMAAAWLLSVCYVKFPSKTLVCIENLFVGELKIKTIRKICESCRVSKEDKEKLKQYSK